MRSALHYRASNSTSSGGFVENAQRRLCLMAALLMAANTNETWEKENAIR
jgi:hypothetical protein